MKLFNLISYVASFFKSLATSMLSGAKFVRHNFTKFTKVQTITIVAALVLDLFLVPVAAHSLKMNASVTDATVAETPKTTTVTEEATKVEETTTEKTVDEEGSIHEHREVLIEEISEASPEDSIDLIGQFVDTFTADDELKANAEFQPGDHVSCALYDDVEIIKIDDSVAFDNGVLYQVSTPDGETLLPESLIYDTALVDEPTTQSETESTTAEPKTESTTAKAKTASTDNTGAKFKTGDKVSCVMFDVGEVVGIEKDDDRYVCRVKTNDGKIYIIPESSLTTVK